jgi:four helix bundle protein
MGRRVSVAPVDRGQWTVDSEGARIAAIGTYMGMPSDFEKLHAYRAAADLGDTVWRVVLDWPSFARWSLGKQLTRSADSVAANIAEGAGRREAPDRRRFYIIARSSLGETEHWLARARARDLAVPDLPTDELGRMLNGLINRPVPS